MSATGRLIVAGTGIRAVGQLTLETVAWVEAADVVCYVLADPLTERWVLEHARRGEDLSRLHDPDQPRLHSYATMAARLVDHARRGATVVGLFYGHPGVFTSPSHWAIELAASEGIPARMLPGISAQDCLFADLGVDPGQGAFQAFEATEMLMTNRAPGVDAHVVLWQFGVIAAQQLQESTGLRAFTDHLLRFYPGDHRVTHYRAPQTVLGMPFIRVVPLAELAAERASVTSTLYIPPLTEATIDADVVAALAERPAVEVERPPSTYAQARRFVGPGCDASHALPAPDWYTPLPGEPSALEGLLQALEEPGTRAAFERTPAVFLAAAGLDPIQMWAVLTGSEEWISACVRHGSGPAAAVALDVAESLDEAREFRISGDGRLVRKRR